MKNKFSYIKVCLFICDTVCIVLGILFYYQVMTGKNELLEYYQTMAQRNELLQSEMTAAIEVLAEENTALLDREKKLTFDIQKFLLNSKKLEEEMSEAESWYEATEIVYQIRQYIDSVSVQIYAGNGSSEYIDRYFRVEKEELQVIVNSYDIREESEAFPIMIQESDMLLPIGEKVWLRYEGRKENNLPLGLFIQNPTVDIGYRNARAGMFLSDIKRSIPANEEYVSLDWGNIYYLPYEDDSYRYYYISVDDRDNPAILYIELKQ